MSRRIFLSLALAGLAAAALAAGQARQFDLALSAGRLASGDVVRVKRGEQVALRWSSDRPVKLHLHGYDIERTVAPQAPAVMSFTAHLAGRFPVSEHGRGGRHGRAILYLEVHP
jgi:hypothetical protein